MSKKKDTFTIERVSTVGDGRAMFDVYGVFLYRDGVVHTLYVTNCIDLAHRLFDTAVENRDVESVDKLKKLVDEDAWLYLKNNDDKCPKIRRLDIER